MPPIAHPAGRTGLPRASGRSNSAMLAVTIAAIGFITLRPTALGEVYSAVSAGVILLAAAALLLLGGGNLRFSRASLLPALMIVLAVYMLSIDILKQSNNIEDAPKAALISVSAALALLAISNRSDFAARFYDTIALVIAAACASILITFALLAAGASPQGLKLFHFSYTYTPPSGDILFPLTLRNNAVPTPIGAMPRLAGIFREVGLLPAFAAWAAYYLSARRFPLALSIICIAASAVCLSSIGPLIALAAAAAVLAQRSKIPTYVFTVVMPVAAVAIFIAVYNMPYFGIAYKIHQVNDSFRDRLIATENVAYTKDVLFGDGASGSMVGSINLISSIYHYGIVGFVLVWLCYLTASRNFRLFIGGLGPCIFTMMTAQPAGAEPLVLCLFMSWLALEAPHKKGRSNWLKLFLQRKISAPNALPARAR